MWVIYSYTGCRFVCIQGFASIGPAKEVMLPLINYFLMRWICCRQHLPLYLLISQVKMLPSKPEVRRRPVLRSYSMFLTQFVWPLSSCSLCFKNLTSQSATVESSEHVANNLESRNLQTQRFYGFRITMYTFIKNRINIIHVLWFI